jgi:hypothetical protein
MSLSQINRNYETKVRSMRKNSTDKIYTKTFVKWLYSICGECETPAELAYSLKGLDHWLVQQQDISINLREFTANYLEKSFKPQTHKLCQCYFQHLYGGNLGSNSISEQENSALKQDHMGPRPNSGIDRSLIATTRHETRRLKELRRTGLKSLSQTVQQDMEGSEDDCSPLELGTDLVNSEMQVCQKSELSRDLINYAWKDLIMQYEASANYLYHHAPGSSEFLVRRLTWAIPPTDNPEDMHHAYVPKFDRTRTVTILNRKFSIFRLVNFGCYLLLK